MISQEDHIGLKIFLTNLNVFIVVVLMDLIMIRLKIEFVKLRENVRLIIFMNYFLYFLMKTDFFLELLLSFKFVIPGKLLARTIQAYKTGKTVSESLLFI